MGQVAIVAARGPEGCAWSICFHRLMRCRFVLWLALALNGVAPVVWADVVLASLFTDHAVLQREKVVPIWGQASAGEKVVVTFAGQRREATATADGRWLVSLEPLVASAVGADLVVVGRNRLVVADVVVGEVWLCAGQSNMEFTLEARAGWQAKIRVDRSVEEVAAARFPLIRHVRIEPTVGMAPASTVKTSGWELTSPATVGGFTAVGYFFARDLHRRLGVPVGLIHSSVGGTPVEAWLSGAALASDPAFKRVEERWQKTIGDFPVAQAEYAVKLAEWTATEARVKSGVSVVAPLESGSAVPAVAPKAKAKVGAAAKAAGKASDKAAPGAIYTEWLRLNPRPQSPRGLGDAWTPTGLFNGMINPLIPWSLRGMVWYQGEENAARASEYRALFEALITGWRAQWGQRDLPFYWVNLANYAAADATGSSWAFLREAQTQTLALANTGQAVAIDLGNPREVHPTNKQEVGRRLALLAKKRIYGMTGDDTGPTYAGSMVAGATLRVRFTHAGSGLVARDKPVQSLEVAGEDRIFYPAEGKIDRDTLVVASPAVRAPVAVRYAWKNAPEANLASGTGLPAVPFRSDTW